MESNERKDAWAVALQLTRESSGILPEEHYCSVGPFDFHAYRHSADYSFSRGNTVTYVNFYEPHATNVFQFLGLLVLGPKLRQSLERDKIRVAHRSETPCPHLEYVWEPDSYSSPKRGSLTALKIELGVGNVAVYREREKFVADVPEMIASHHEFPDCLIGAKEILGRPIPWDINFNRLGRNILAKSKFAEFVRALEDRAEDAYLKNETI